MKAKPTWDRPFFYYVKLRLTKRLVGINVRRDHLWKWWQVGWSVEIFGFNVTGGWRS